MLLGRTSGSVVIAATFFGFATAHATPAAYTDDATFLAAVTGATVITFEGLPVPTDAVQQLSVAGSSGTFTLTFNGQQTGQLAFNATAAQVQTALNGLSSIGGAGGSVMVTGGAGTLDVVFGGTLADTSVATLSAAGSGGATATSSVVTAGNLGTTFPSGAPGLGNVASFVYNQTGAPLTVNTSSGATSGVNVLKGFGPGQSLDLAFASPVTAAGLFVIASQPIAPGQVSLVADGPMSAVQTLQIGGTTGTYTLTFNGQTTGLLAANATAAAIQSALDSLSSIGGAGGSVAVTSAGSGAFTVTFGGALADTAVGPLTGIGGGGASVSLGTLISGTPGGAAFTAGNGALAAPGQDEVQQLNVGGATSGTYTLTFNGQTTPPLSATATAAQIQAALNALSSIGGSVTVTGGAGSFDVTFGGALANTDLPPIAASGAGGTTATTGTLVAGASGGSTLPAAQGANEEQQLTISGPGGSTYTLAFNGQTTGQLAANATAAAIQAALDSLSSIGGVGGSVTVTGGAGTFDVTFGGALADTDLSLLSAAGSGGATGNVTELVQGQPEALAYFIGLTSDTPLDDIEVDFGGAAATYLLDDITTGTALQGEVPEPASFALLGAGLAALGFARRRNS